MRECGVALVKTPSDKEDPDAQGLKTEVDDQEFNNNSRLLTEMKKRLQADTMRTTEATKRWKMTRQFLRQCLTEIGCNDRLLLLRQLRLKTLTDGPVCGELLDQSHENFTAEHNGTGRKTAVDDSEAVMRNFDFLSSEDVDVDENNAPSSTGHNQNSEGGLSSKFSRVTKGGGYRREILDMLNRLNDPEGGQDDYHTTSNYKGNTEPRSYHNLATADSSSNEQQTNIREILTLHDATGAQMSLGDLADVNIHNDNENFGVPGHGVVGAPMWSREEGSAISGKEDYCGKRMLDGLDSHIVAGAKPSSDGSARADDFHGDQQVTFNAGTQVISGICVPNISTQLKTLCTLRGHLDSIRTVSFAPSLDCVDWTSEKYSGTMQEEGGDDTEVLRESKYNNPPVVLTGSDDGTLKILSYERMLNNSINLDNISSNDASVNENFDLHCAPNRANPCVLTLFHHNSPVLCSYWCRLESHHRWYYSKTLILSGDLEGKVFAVLVDNAILEFGYTNRCNESAYIEIVDLIRKEPSLLRPIQLIGPEDAVWGIGLSYDGNIASTVSADGCLYSWSVSEILSLFEDEETAVDNSDENQDIVKSACLAYVSTCKITPEWVLQCIRDSKTDEKSDEASLSSETLISVNEQQIVPTCIYSVTVDSHPGRSCFAVGLSSGHVFVAEFGSSSLTDEQSGENRKKCSQQIDPFLFVNASQKPGTSVNCLAGHSTLPLVLIGLSDGSIVALNYNSSCIEYRMCAHEEAVSGIAFHPMGLYFATISHDDRLRVWNHFSYSCCHDESAHRNRDSESGLCVAFQSHEDFLLASGGADGVVKVYKFTVSSSGQQFPDTFPLAKKFFADENSGDSSSVTMEL